MRDPNRLDRFYGEFKKIHKEKFPDWREGQMWVNFLSWVQNRKKKDPFFCESEELLKLFKEFAKVNE